jgi:hypothetical protein
MSPASANDSLAACLNTILHQSMAKYLAKPVLYCSWYVKGDLINFCSWKSPQDKVFCILLYPFKLSCFMINYGLFDFDNFIK